MEKENKLKRRDFIKTTAVGAAGAGLGMLSLDAQAQKKRAPAKKKDVAWVQERANQHYFIERFN